MDKKLTTKKSFQKNELSEIELERLRQAFSIGCNDQEACAYAEVSFQKFQEYIKKNSGKNQEFINLKQKSILKAKHTIFSNLNNIKVAQWYLEWKRKEEL